MDFAIGGAMVTGWWTLVAWALICACLTKPLPQNASGIDVHNHNQEEANNGWEENDLSDFA
jgi:hypothetical protein